MIKKDENLYVIESGEYSDFDYYGVFDTRKEAENMILFIVNKIHEKYILDNEYHRTRKPIFKSYKEYMKWKKSIKLSDNPTFVEDYWINEVPLNRIKDENLEDILEFDTGINAEDFHKVYRKWRLNQFKKREKGHNNENL